MSAKDEQIGGDHYKKYPIQPMEFFHFNGVPKMEGDIMQYVMRWRDKNGLVDLRKALHLLTWLIELEEKRQAEERDAVMHSGAAFKK
jgi:hypothetical protein